MAGQDKEDGVERKGRKGLPAIVLVALGAVLGGAGVVFAVPPKEPEAPVRETPPTIVQREHPDLLKFLFNPVVQSGKAVAVVNFRFVYEVRSDKVELAQQYVDAHLNRARSNCLLLLRARTIRELQTDQPQLTKDLVEELNFSLFGRPQDRVAEVTEILWDEIRIQ